jgi:hypothetical protein
MRTDGQTQMPKLIGDFLRPCHKPLENKMPFPTSPEGPDEHSEEVETGWTVSQSRFGPGTS